MYVSLYAYLSVSDTAVGPVPLQARHIVAGFRLLQLRSASDLFGWDVTSPRLACNGNVTCHWLAGMMCALGGTGSWMIAATYWEVRASICHS
jgi:hypothetical protein